VLAQPSLNFPQAVASDLGDPNNGNAGAVSAGIAATAYNGTLWSAFVLDSNDVSCPGHLALQGVYNNSSTPHTPSMYYARVCTYLDRPNGQPQMTAFNGNIWVAYASADYYNYLFVASWNATSGWAVGNVGSPVVNPGPAIGTFNGKLYVAYQSADSNHYLTLLNSTDGRSWTSPVTQYYAGSPIRIGHNPAIVQFGNKLVVAAFCQCSSHALDVYTSTDGFTWSKTEDTTQTLSNLSAPSLAVSNGVLAVAYVRNGTNDIYTSTSSNAVNWTTAQRQSNNLSFSAGGSALAVLPDNSVFVVYQSERAVSWDSLSGPHQEYYSLAPPL
jgi:hypothetical protein